MTYQENLPVMIDRAARSLAAARTAAEVLEIRDMAAEVYDQAKRAARLQRAKNAHDDIVARLHRTQADALEIEAAAKRRLADEYDAAVGAGEVAGHGGARNFKVPDGNLEPTAADLGLSRKSILEARQIRDAEAAHPGIVRRTLDVALSEGREPSKSVLRRALAERADVRIASRSEDRPSDREDPDRIDRKRLNGQIWMRLREGLSALSNLPRPVDVVRAVSGQKVAIVDAHLAQAVRWLREFDNVWNERCKAAADAGQAADRDGDADARDGSRTAAG